jgi:XTP/dITP diphosphohydrolase
VLATSNPGKVAEFVTLLNEMHCDLTVVAQSELGVTSPPETAVTFVENALLKARHAARVTGLPSIADDSGLAVAALGGAPGVHSARFAGPSADDRANVVKLLAAMEGVPAGARQASFHCVLVALTHAQDPAPLIASGDWHGEIASASAGNHGFGYDPVFFDHTHGRTAAELPAPVKNQVSHRGTAMRQLMAMLQRR